MDFQPQNKPNSFSVVSMIFGILSLLSLCCLIYFSPLFGGLAILFALLSKGYEKEMNGNAMAGLSTGIIGLAISCIFIPLMLIMWVFLMNSKQFSSEFWSSYKEVGERIYGEQFDDILEDTFGEDFDIDHYIEGGSVWSEE
ncbi:MAG: hypothetical protein GX234_09900 [Clostridiales bacterium]|nr:hypothetical protein [Clostridiales bacterium]